MDSFLNGTAADQNELHRHMKHLAADILKAAVKKAGVLDLVYYNYWGQS